MYDIFLWTLIPVVLFIGLFLGFLLGRQFSRSPSNNGNQTTVERRYRQSDNSVSTSSQTDTPIFQNPFSKPSNKYNNSLDEGEEEIKLEKDDVQQQFSSRKFSNNSSNNNYFDDNISSEHSEISDFMGGSTSPDEFMSNKRKASLTQQMQSKLQNQEILGQTEQNNNNIPFNDEFTEDDSSSELQSSSQPQKETKDSQSITSSITNGTLEKSSSSSNNILLALVPVKDTQIFSQQQNKIAPENEGVQLIRGTSDQQEVEHHALINEIGGYVQRSKSAITTGNQSGQKTVLSEKSEKELFFEQCPLQDQPTRKQAEFKIEYEQDKKKGIFRKIETHQVVVDYAHNSKIEKEVQDVKMSLLHNFNLKDNHSLNGFKISQAKFFMPLQSIPELDPQILNNNQINNINNRQLAVYQQPQQLPAHVIPIFDYGNFKEYLDTGKFKKFFKVIEELGRGGFGRVYKVQCSNEDKTYAIKKIVVPFDRDTNPKNHKYFREVTSIMSINHIHIVRYHTSWWEYCDDEMLTQVNEFLQTTNNSQNKSSSSSSDSNSNSFENQNVGQNQPQSNSNQHNNQTGSVVEISYPELSCIEWDQTEQNKEKHSTLNQKTAHTAEKLNSGNNKNNSNKIPKIIEEKQAVHSFKHQNKSHKAFNFSKNSQLLTLYIQLEYCSGKTLRNFLDEREAALSFHAAFDIFSQVLDGVLCLHQNGIIHRDLKPSNILLDNSVVKIGDFGLSIKQDMEEYNINYDKNSSSQQTEEIKSSSVTHTSNVGTPFYMPPEQADKSGKYNEKIDIFSLGIILLEMIYKTTTHHEKLDVFRKLKLSQELPQKLSANRKHECSLILTMTHPDPITRPSIKEILDSSSFLAWKKKAKHSQQKEHLYFKQKQQQ